MGIVHMAVMVLGMEDSYLGRWSFAQGLEGWECCTLLS